jgi:Protein of unknown function (DUF3667)
MHDEPHMSHAQVPCLNCGALLVGPHCHQCGQGAHVRRFNWHRLIHELPHAVFHVHRGIVPTIGGLLWEPGRTIRAYLDGQHARYFNPLTLLVLAAGAYALLYQSSVLLDPLARHLPDRSRNTTMELVKLLVRWYSLSMVVMIPFVAFGSWRVFLAAGRNFAEHIVAMTYITALGTLLMVLPGFPVLVAVSLFFGDSATWLGLTWAVVFCALQLYQAWALYDLFRDSGSRVQAWWKVSLASGYVLIGTVAIGFVVAVVWDWFD